ncbi:hypothetical protein [Deinococcus sp. QL22]|uniref:hypothetical protein n=1 Tax=Deinococcus sp. QL22 TaxID=2939437 RepID=UPI002016F4A1|nr:hypothetical protein [Deinococcus sp. QL22]UQN06492.1 hypothetical protein M1R55_00815 [Deinococcus sp. QL22]
MALLNTAALGTTRHRPLAILLGTGLSLLLLSTVPTLKVPGTLVAMCLLSTGIWAVAPKMRARLFPGLLILTALSGLTNFLALVAAVGALIAAMLLQYGSLRSNPLPKDPVLRRKRKKELAIQEYSARHARRRKIADDRHARLTRPAPARDDRPQHVKDVEVANSLAMHNFPMVPVATCATCHEDYVPDGTGTCGACGVAEDDDAWI